MFYLVGFLIIAGMIAGFSATVSLGLRRFRPDMTMRRRQWGAALTGALITLSPALVASARAGPRAFLAVCLGAAILAVIVGYPAVRFFEPAKPAA